MRTPNTNCIICGKLLYRRPSEINRYNASCCITCRSAYYKTKEPSLNLLLGREKGTNHLSGIPKSKESNLKRSESHKRYSKLNPEKIKERGAKIRAENHYKWNGGSSKLNVLIRTMNENRKWMNAVKERDMFCRHCGEEIYSNLESHHIIPLSMIIEKYNIKSRDEARECAELWDIENGITLCRKCHYKLHNRTYAYGE